MKYNEYVSISKNITEVGSKYSQVLNNPQNIAQDCLNFTKVAKFRQIWSHCMESLNRRTLLPIQIFISTYWSWRRY